MNTPPITSDHPRSARFGKRRGRGGRDKITSSHEHSMHPNSPHHNSMQMNGGEGRDGSGGDHHGHRGHRGRGGRGRGFGPGGFGPGGFGPGGPGGPGRGGPFGGRRRGGRARRGDVRLAALLLISEGPTNGYQIIQTLDERTGGAWKPSPGAVYPALDQLRDEGLITAAEDGKTFEITGAGQREVAEHGDRPKPWELISAPEAGADADLWAAVEQAAMAANAVAMTGDEAMIAKAAEQFAATRKALYKLLADEG